jgi:hypothetical protein
MHLQKVKIPKQLRSSFNRTTRSNKIKGYRSLFTLNIKRQQSIVTKYCNCSSLFNFSLKHSYLMKHQLAVTLKASNVLLQQFKVTIKINYSNNLVKKISQALERNIFLTTDGRYISMAAYIDQNIVIVESEG